jgi:hypothetical protein
MAYALHAADRVGELGPIGGSFPDRVAALKERDRRMAARKDRTAITWFVPDPDGEGESCEWTEDEEAAAAAERNQ